MSWFSRLRNAVHPRRLDEDLAEEMRDHLERRSAALREKGLSDAEAQREALVRFGNTTQLREKSRDIGLWVALESIFQDTRYAWRGMRKSPAFAATAVFSLGLAIGANTAIYSIVDAALLRPLPVPQPERLFTLGTPDIEQPGSETSGERESFSYPLYLQFRRDAGQSAQLALFSYPNRVEAQGPGASAPVEKVTRQFVSGDAFDILRVPPALGRVFSSGEDRTPGGHPLAVLSHDYWRRRFNADWGVLGKEIQVDGKMFSIIGVARAGFFGVEPGKFIDVWIPAMMYNNEAFTNPGWSWFHIVGRLAPGATRQQLQARLQPRFHEMLQDVIKRYPTMPPAIKNQFKDLAIRVHPGAAGASRFRKTFARPLWIVLGVAAGILLIACANVASLLLARSTARSAEMAMRVSLGAGRSRLVRQLLTESVLLSALAGGLGWMLARSAAPALVSLLSKEGDPVRFVLAIDTRVLLFCAAVSALAAVVFGLLPAWQASGVQPMSAVRGIRAQAGKLRMGRFFVGVQVAFAFCLVMAGAAFLFSLRNLFAVDTGFDPRGVAVISVSSALDNKQEPALRVLMEQLQRRIAALPGIQAAAIAPWAIFEGSSWTDQVILPGKAPSVREEIFYRVSPGYFAALHTPILSGRDFDHRDSAGEPVSAIVNRAFARKYFERENVLGNEFQTPEGKKLIRYRVVGVAANAHYGELRKGPEPMVYVPLQGTNYFSLYARSPLDLGSVAHLVEREARAMGSGTRVREITTLETLVGNTILKEKLLAGIGGVFAFLGLVLAAIGLFGLLNYSVARRTKEIGIRAALGAQRNELVLLVLKDLFAMVSGGLMAGLAGSLAVMMLLRSLLFGIKPADPLVIGTAIAVFLVAALVAGGFPASRAATVDPMVALRNE
ncbi:MAG: ADOP family duplicated permease [Bryobacteraceae bacterium]